LTKDKDLVVELKSSHRFNMKKYDDSYCENADRTTLEENADGTSLIFFFNNRSLIFDSNTLQLKQNLQYTVFDILGSSYLLYRRGFCLSELNKLDK